VVTTCEKGNLDLVDIFLRYQPVLLKLDGAHRCLDGAHLCLMSAIEKSKCEVAKKLILEGGAKLDFWIQKSYNEVEYKSFLTMSIYSKMFDIATLLIDHGAETNKNSKANLTAVCINGQVDLLKKILDTGCLYKHFLKDLLDAAAIHDQVEVLGFFQQKGDEVYLNGQILQAAIVANSLGAVKFLCIEKLSPENIEKEQSMNFIWS
jgi:hypothetical protein